VVTYGPGDLTPWENLDGMWYKREDYHRHPNGVNGAKYRLCRHLIATAVVEHGYDHVVTAQSVRSPQAAITATLCQEMGLGCTVVIGASKPETAVKHRSIEIAVEAGAMLDTSMRVAYNGVIQPYAERLSKSLDAYQVPYAISPPANSSPEALDAALAVGGAQVENLPSQIKTLVSPFGSGNTTAGLLHGLHSTALKNKDLERVILVGVGPDRTDWLWERLGVVAIEQAVLPPIEHMPLHGWFADYADLMPETIDDIVMHPTYEGKVVRFLNWAKPDWWTARDGTTGFWIVGGPM
jgi:hypothetical protein